jgi:RNA polymerase sigma-70 factor (ECF subfamily)
VMLHDAEGCSLEEIGQITGTALGTVKSRLHRGRARLRALLGQGTFFT